MCLWLLYKLFLHRWVMIILFLIYIFVHFTCLCSNITIDLSLYNYRPALFLPECIMLLRLIGLCNNISVEKLLHYYSYYCSNVLQGTVWSWIGGPTPKYHNNVKCQVSSVTKTAEAHNELTFNVYIGKIKNILPSNCVFQCTSYLIFLFRYHYDCSKLLYITLKTLMANVCCNTSLDDTLASTTLSGQIFCIDCICIAIYRECFHWFNNISVTFALI